MNTFDLELQKIQRFITKSYEGYDDWDWDGEVLHVFDEGECIETYTKEELIEEKII